MQASFFLNSRSGRAPLRIGLLVDSSVQPAWVAEVIQQIARSNFARLELVVYNADGQKKATVAEPPPPLLRRIVSGLSNAKQRRSLLFRLYSQWDQRCISAPDNPFRETDCFNYFKNVESIVVAPVTKRYVHRFPDEAIRTIREKQLDVLIRFGFNILRGDILQSARYGVWSYHHGDNEFYRGGPAYFWELYEANPISGALLQVLTEELDAGKVLYKGFFATCMGLSWARNRIQPYWGASSFVIQKLHQLHERGRERVESEVIPTTPYLGRVKVYTTPTNLQMLRWLGFQLIGKAAARCRRLLRKSPDMTHWKLAVNSGDRAQLAPERSADLDRLKWVASPRGHFYADPFLFNHEERPWVFFEDFDYATALGRIVAAEVLPNGDLSSPVPVLEKPYHLSYPCVFRVGEEIYMVPESRANGTVEMYRCKNFPDSWELVKVLLHAPAVDTTVWVENGIHWFFVTLREPRGGGLQLWLFYCKDIMEEWTSHPCNPISTDIRRSRGGGAIYRRGSRLIRPSQDCSGNYGRSFTLNEIVVLSQLEYKERPYLTVNAPDSMIGTHTYSQLGKLEIVDGCTILPARNVL